MTESFLQGLKFNPELAVDGYCKFWVNTLWCSYKLKIYEISRVIAAK
jgi:hypothetical protein